jgi:hypothetical protein
MKACLRLFLVLLIIVALPVTGMAALQLSAEPCQMQDDSQVSEHVGHLLVAQDDDEHAHDGNPLCESGHQCKSGSMLQSTVLKPGLGASLPLLVLSHSEFFPARSGADVWRPPRH